MVHNSMGKKKVEEMKSHRERFVQGAKERGVPEEEANRLFDMLEAFANYGFNKCLPARARVVDWCTGRVVRVGEIVRGEAKGVWVVSLDEARLRLVPRPVVAAFPSGKAQVYALRTATGRVLEATANHPVYTPEGWRPLGTLAPGDYVALPRHLSYRPSSTWRATSWTFWASPWPKAISVTLPAFTSIPPPRRSSPPWRRLCGPSPTPASGWSGAGGGPRLRRPRGPEARGGRGGLPEADGASRA